MGRGTGDGSGRDGRLRRRACWSTGWYRAAGSDCSARNLGINILHGTLKIDELLVEFAEARFYFFEIVGKTLHLRGHGVQSRAGICLYILHGFLQAAHGAVELANRVVGLLDEGAHDGVVLRDLSSDILLALQQGSHVALQFNDFASDRFGGPRSDQAAAQRANEKRGGKTSEIAKTHEELLLSVNERCVPTGFGQDRTQSATCAASQF